MQGGNISIKNEEQLLKSWKDKMITSWEAYDGDSTRERYFRKDISYDFLKSKMQYYFKNIENKDAFITGEIQ
jgi:hypothetical protein